MDLILQSLSSIPLRLKTLLLLGNEEILVKERTPLKLPFYGALY